MAAHLLGRGFEECGFQFAKQRARVLEAAHFLLFACACNGFKTEHYQERIGELVAVPADATIGVALRQQTIASQGGVLLLCADLQRSQEGDSVHHLRLEFMQERPILAQLALADKRIQGNAGILPVTQAGGADELAGALLPGPHGAQSFLGILVIAQVASGFEDEISVRHP